MSTLLDLPPMIAPTTGDKALITINKYRSAVDDHFSVDDLSDEFPGYAHWLQRDGIYLAHAEDNIAGAFKWRGAFVGAQQLLEQGHEHLIVPSAGNHARGAILAAKALDMSIDVIVPTSAPPAKKERLAELWKNRKVSLHVAGQTFDDSLEWAKEHANYGTLLHPYDDPYVAAGQGTLVDDILQKRHDTQHIVVPVGGGGLLAGVIGRLLELGRDDIHVHGIESPGSDSLSRSLRANEVIAASHPNQRFGGSAIRYTGSHTLRLCMSYPRLDILQVDEEKINHVSDDYEQDREELLRQSTPNFEPTALVAIAGLEKIAHRFPTDIITVIGTGQNDVLHRPSTAHMYRVPA
jgi:threonine dehydratase